MGEEISMPRRFYSSGMEPFPKASINYNSKMALMAQLKEALSPDEWDHLRDSLLGVCVKFYELDFNWASRIVHYMLTFQLECQKEYEIWCLIGSEPTRFSLLEYEAITGLDCSYLDNVDEPVVENNPHVSAFWKNLKVAENACPSIAELSRACEACGSWSVEDRVRLGCLCIYATFFEGVDRRSATNVKLAKLVMDLSRFMSYPWGRVGFLKLIKSVKDAVLTKPSYVIEGWAQVLQVWIYHALPRFGFHKGEAFQPPVVPCILSYKGSRVRKNVKDAMQKERKVLNFEAAAEAIWDNETDDPIIDLMLSEMYKKKKPFNKSTWVGAGIYDNEVVLPTSSPPRKKIKKSVTVSVSPGAESSVGGESSDSDRSNSMYLTKLLDKISTFESSLPTELAKTMATCRSEVATSLQTFQSAMTTRMEELQASVIASVDCIKTRVEVLEQAKDIRKDSTSGKQMRRSRNESYNVVGKYKGNKFGSEGEFRGGKVKSVVNNVDENKGKEPTKAESSIVVWVGTGDCDDLTEKLARQKTEQTAAAILYRAKSARERKLAPSQKTPYTGAKIVKNLVTGQNSNNRYDPFEKPNHVKVVSLNIWLESNGNTARGKESNEWYHRLRTPSDWLRDVHLDAAMAMLRRRYYFNSRCFRSARLAFLDTIFQVLWIDKYRQFLQSQPKADGTGRLLPPGTFDYVNGLKPVEFNTGKVWLSEVDDIYCPLNVSNSHWVAMWISLPNRKITIFDSHVFMKLVFDEVLEKVVTPFATMIPYAMRAVNPDANTSITPYTWERIKAGVPQNRKSGDCGVYVFKYLECHALGLYPFPKALRDSNIKQIREKLAVEIFDELAETGQRDCDAGDVDLYEREG